MTPNDVYLILKRNEGVRQEEDKDYELFLEKYNLFCGSISQSVPLEGKFKRVLWVRISEIAMQGLIFSVFYDDQDKLSEEFFVVEYEPVKEYFKIRAGFENLTEAVTYSRIINT